MSVKLNYIQFHLDHFSKNKLVTWMTNKEKSSTRKWKNDVGPKETWIYKKIKIKWSRYVGCVNLKNRSTTFFFQNLICQNAGFCVFLPELLDKNKNFVLVTRQHPCPKILLEIAVKSKRIMCIVMKFFGVKTSKKWLRATDHCT